jgi:hypothetical protein
LAPIVLVPYSRIDSRLSKTLNLGPARLTLIDEAFNLFHRRNL